MHIIVGRLTTYYSVLIRFLFFTKEYPSHFGPTLLGVIGWPIAVLFLICLAFNLKNKKALEVTYRNIRDGQKKYEETKKFILFIGSTSN